MLLQSHHFDPLQVTPPVSGPFVPSAKGMQSAFSVVVVVVVVEGGGGGGGGSTGPWVHAGHSRESKVRGMHVSKYITQSSYNTTQCMAATRRSRYSCTWYCSAPSP